MVNAIQAGNVDMGVDDARSTSAVPRSREEHKIISRIDQVPRARYTMFNGRRSRSTTRTRARGCVRGRQGCSRTSFATKTSSSWPAVRSDRPSWVREDIRLPSYDPIKAKDFVASTRPETGKRSSYVPLAEPTRGSQDHRYRLRRKDQMTVKTVDESQGINT